MKDFLTVSQLNFYINDLISNETLLHNVPVLGEVSGRSVTGGHLYFTLKDEKAQIKVIFFNCSSAYVPENGEKVLVHGRADYYLKSGQLSLKAYNILPYGRGELQAKLEQLKTKLSDEGLFAPERKKAIPPYPKNVAIITSINGAAFQDFFTTVRKKNEIIDITAIDVRVQGESSAADIVAALTAADCAAFDVIVLARGGGSFEDLFSFNDEDLVRAVANAETPIISAIGHETDYTLCDFAADYRAITPTAAAEKVGYDVKAEKRKIIGLINDIAEEVADRYSAAKYSVKDSASLLQNSAVLLYERQRRRLKTTLSGINAALKLSYTIKETKLKGGIERLENLSPIKLLDKGYFKIEENGRPVHTVSALSVGQEISIIGPDGRAAAKILSKGEHINELRK